MVEELKPEVTNCPCFHKVCTRNPAARISCQIYSFSGFLINHHLLHFIYYKFVPFSSFLLFRYKKKILHPLLLNFFPFGHDLPYDFFLIQVPGSSRADPPQCLSMAWSADGQTLCAGYSDNLIRVGQVMLSI